METDVKSACNGRMSSRIQTGRVGEAAFSDKASDLNYGAATPNLSGIEVSAGMQGAPLLRPSHR